jgi:glycosyltransferase involved in cell wall biosynthesis
VHVCMVTGGLTPILPKRIGAIEPYAYNLAKELAKTDEVHIFGVGQGQTDEGNLHIQTFPYGEKVPIILGRFFSWRVGHYVPFSACMVEEILRLHLKNPIDILHIHEIYAGFAASFTKLMLGIPYVITIHNEVPTILPVKTCNKALAVSSYIADFLVNKKDFSPNKVAILNVAVDTEISASLKSPIQAKEELRLYKRRIVLFVGRKCPEKGPQILLKALPKIVERNPDILAVFIGPDFDFGGTSTVYTDYLRSEALKMGLEHNVRFEGHISDEDKMRYFAASDVFVCPSVWQDPSPTVIKEALSFGKPVVATTVGGTSDIITSGYNGLLVSPNSNVAIAESVLFLLDNPLYAQTLGLNGRKTVEQKFSFKTVANQCSQIYNELI